MPSRRLVLASASPARLALLRAAGLAPEVVVSGEDEDGVAGLPATEAARRLALRKAVAVAGRLADGATAGVRVGAAGSGAASRTGGPDRGATGDGDGDGALVLGCDSLLLFAGELRGKPASAGEATAWWRSYRRASGTLVTGHALVEVGTGRQATGVAETLVRFGDPTDAEIAALVATGEPLAVAGGFTLDGYAAPFVDGIDGDHGTVLGLSMPLLRRLLADLGVGLTDLW
ncbi:MAG TPA: Maf family protein [Acidimicrobiales bacterium]|nr:Maf family protein [Acidimicrobiales bacterium]